MTKIRENKDRFIMQNPNLSHKQVAELLNFFSSHPEQEGKIKNWNTNIPYETFKKVIRAYNERFLSKTKFGDLKEGVDYEFLTDDDYYSYYVIYTYEASVAFASNNIEPRYYSKVPRWYENADGFSNNLIQDYPEEGEDLYGGAKWCISMNHTRKYWDAYITENKDLEKKMFFIFAIAKNTDDQTPYCKLAICVSVELGGNYIDTIYDASDNSISLDSDISEMVYTAIGEYKEDIDLDKVKVFDYTGKMVDCLTAVDKQLEDYNISKYGKDAVIAFNEALGNPVDKYWTQDAIEEYVDDEVDSMYDLIVDFSSYKSRLSDKIVSFHRAMNDSYLPDVKTVKDFINYIFDENRVFNCNFPFLVVATYLAQYMDYFGFSIIRVNFPKFFKEYKEAWGDHSYKLDYSIKTANYVFTHSNMDRAVLCSELLNFMKNHISEDEFIDSKIFNAFKVIKKSGRIYCFRANLLYAW